MTVPTFLPEKTLEFMELVPYAIAFTHDDKLVVLGREEKPSDEGKEEDMINHEDLENLKMELRVYSEFLKGRAEARCINTQLESTFDGIAGFGSTSFQGSLSVGSDGLIYVGGSGRWRKREIKRFSSSLDEIVDQRLAAIVNLLKEEDTLPGDREIYQIQELDGLFYLSFQPNSPDYRQEWNGIVATDGTKIIGKPLNYRTTEGILRLGWNINPQFIVGPSSLYVKARNTIVAVDKSLLTETLRNSRLVIPPNQKEKTCVASHPCLYADTLYVVTQGPEEDNAGSIKGYVLEGNQGKLVSSFVPPHPEHPPGLRSMAISPSGLLAYSDPSERKIHFYQL